MQGMTSSVLFEFNTLESSCRKINYKAARKNEETNKNRHPSEDEKKTQ